ncbi:MAG: tetratricopeptide repeat protein, partial [Treponema sp.]|nr:tetratricopeptide repeat protein [Treponema sp.]
MRRFPAWVLSLILSAAALSCAGTPAAGEGIPVTPPLDSAGISAGIRSLVETGTPVSLTRALEEIRARGLGDSEFGRVMVAVIAALWQSLYADLPASYPRADPPQNHVYARILREAAQGNYSSPVEDSQDYLSLALPFLALMPVNAGSDPARLRAAEPALLRARDIRPDAAPVFYFLGLVYEYTSRLEQALEVYARAWELSPECHPAALGLVRTLGALERPGESISLLTDMSVRYPGNDTVKRLLAQAYYQSGDWNGAEPVLAGLLELRPEDAGLILMQIRVYLELRRYSQARELLSRYSQLYPDNRSSLLLRARLQAEGSSNRSAALTCLRSLLASWPDDLEAAEYITRLLLDSSRPEDIAEGRRYLESLLARPGPSLEVISMAFRDAVSREAWEEARPSMERVLAERRSSQDLLDAYQLEHALGNYQAALVYARELYQREPANEEGILAYAAALVDTGGYFEAGRLINNRLAVLPQGSFKGRYYYLRSRLQVTDEMIQEDLRSCLYEDPRNLDALMALIEFYHSR